MLELCITATWNHRKVALVDSCEPLYVLSLYACCVMPSVEIHCQTYLTITLFMTYLRVF